MPRSGRMRRRTCLRRSRSRDAWSLGMATARDLAQESNQIEPQRHRGHREKTKGGGRKRQKGRCETTEQYKREHRKNQEAGQQGLSQQPRWHSLDLLCELFMPLSFSVFALPLCLCG